MFLSANRHRRPQAMTAAALNFPRLAAAIGPAIRIDDTNGGDVVIALVIIERPRCLYHRNYIAIFGHNARHACSSS